MMMAPHKSQRGFAMGTILIIIFVAAILAFTLATASTYQLRVSQTLDSQAHARNLSESVINLAMAKLSDNPDFGKDGESVEVKLDNTGRALLTFDSSEAGSEGVMVSSYNLDSKQAKPAEGMEVPAESVRLVGLATVGQARAEVECVYFRPAFPIALSCGGSLTANDLYLGGLIEGATFPGSVSALTPNKTRPADLISNGSLVDIKANCDILGDVSAVGEVQVAKGAHVRGAVRSRVAATPLPELDGNEFVRKILQAGIDPIHLPSSIPSPLEVDCYTVASGSRTLHGDIDLVGGVLHVQGDFRVTGEIRGSGVILVDGDAEFSGSNNLSGAEAVNIICKKDLTLIGKGSRDKFRGLFYCDGVLEAKNALLLGSAISHGNASVENLDLVHNTTSVSTSFGIPRRYENGDDTMFWRVDPVRDPESGAVTYNYVASLFHAPGVTVNGPDEPYFLGRKRGRRKTAQQVISELQEFGNSDYQGEQATYYIGDKVAADLPDYLAKISAKNPPEEVVISLDVNRLLAPAQRNRILLWRYRER